MEGKSNSVNTAAFPNSFGVMRTKPNANKIPEIFPVGILQLRNSRRTLIGYPGGVFSVELRLLKARLCVQPLKNN